MGKLDKVTELPKEILSDPHFEKLEEDSNNVVELKAWMSQLRRNNEDVIKSSSYLNAELILQNDSNLKETIGYNEFSGDIHLLKDSPWLKREAGTWEDSYEAAILSYIEKNYNVVFEAKKLHNAVINVSRDNTFNPVKERIEAREWDGTERVETFFIDFLGVEDNLYTREVTKRWIVGAVSRIYQPAIKFEIVPILTGKQGIGKSTIASKLFTEEYFSDSLKTLGEKKDDYLQLKRNVVLELGELSAMKKTEIEGIKNFISARYDDIREPYARNTVKWPRRCVFIGTSNDSQYLKDLTGERRFYPMPCVNEPSKNLFNETDDYFLQVLAEAKELYDNNQPIYFDKSKDKDVLTIAEQYQEEAKVEDPIKDAIVKYLTMEVPIDWDDAPSWVRRSYFERYPVSKTDYNLLKNFNHERLLLLDSVLTTDILEVVFDKPVKDLLKGRTDSETKKIRLIVTSLPNWEYQQIYKRNNRRGFFNKKNSIENKLRKS